MRIRSFFENIFPLARLSVYVSVFTGWFISIAKINDLRIEANEENRIGQVSHIRRIDQWTCVLGKSNIEWIKNGGQKRKKKLIVFDILFRTYTFVNSVFIMDEWQQLINPSIVIFSSYLWPLILYAQIDVWENAIKPI